MRGILQSRIGKYECSDSLEMDATKHASLAGLKAASQNNPLFNLTIFAGFVCQGAGPECFCLIVGSPGHGAKDLHAAIAQRLTVEVDRAMYTQNAYIYLYVYIYICIYIYIHIHIYIYIHTYVYIYIHTHTYIYTHTYINIHTYIHMHIYIYMRRLGDPL